MSLWDRIYKLAWILIVVVIVVAVVCVFLPQYARYRDLQFKKKQLEQESKVEEAKLDHFRTVQEKFRTDPSFVELTAREAGMVKTNEALVKMADDD